MNRMILRYYNIFAFVFVFSILTAIGQEAYYAVPVKIPVFLSGNFGELRSSHFHAGIDIKTEQRVGIPVYAAAAGYVSRIIVSPTGYGKALFVSHPNGTTSVYAHLHRFNDPIDEFVRSEQYRRQTFAVDIKLLPGRFQFDKHDLIAYAGNSGSSEAPHLHFEIRETRSQDAINPKKEFVINDNIPPRIHALQLHPLDGYAHISSVSQKRRFSLVRAGTNFTLGGQSSVQAFGKIGISIMADDLVDGSMNSCGIYSAELLVNGITHFGWRLDRIPSDKGRYVSSHIDYAEWIQSRNRFQKMWRDPGNFAGFYHNEINRGMLNIEEGKNYDIQIVLADYQGNTSRLSFRITGVYRELSPSNDDCRHYFAFDEVNYFRRDDIELLVPEGALYDDFCFSYRKGETRPGFLSPVHTLHNEKVPLHRPVRLRILPDANFLELNEKMVIARVLKSGALVAQGGKPRRGWIEAEIRAFGDYTVAADTVPPKIVSLSIKNNSLTEQGRVRFKISDNLSGIKAYSAKINGEWALFEYDQKNNLLEYVFDKRHIKPGTVHRLELTVTDHCHNTSHYEATFRK